MGGQQLEKHLGELNGLLQGMVPAIERLEERQGKAERDAATLLERAEGIRRDMEDQKTRCGGRAVDLYKKCGDAISGNQQNVLDIQALQKEVDVFKNKNEGFVQKAWDLFKIIFTVGLTAFVTWILTRKG